MAQNGTNFNNFVRISDTFDSWCTPLMLSHVFLFFFSHIPSLQRASIQEVTPLPNGDSHRGRGSRDLGHPLSVEPITSSLPLTQTTQALSQIKTTDSYSCTLPMPRKMSTEIRLATLGECSSLVSACRASWDSPTLFKRMTGRFSI